MKTRRKIISFIERKFWLLVTIIFLIQLIILLVYGALTDDSILWFNLLRGMPRKIPYLTTDQFIIGATEYPIGFTYFLFAFFPFRADLQLFSKIFGLVQLAFALGIIGILYRLVNARHRIFVFTLAPTVLILGPARFDLAVSFFVLFSLYFIVKCREKIASFFISIASLLKIYPAMFLPTFLRSDVKKSRKVNLLFYFLLFVIIFNLPLLLTNPKTIIFPFKNPTANFRPESFFGMLNLLDLAPPVAIAKLINYSFLIILFLIGFSKSRTTLGRFVALIIALVITASIFSPQWNIWLLPLLILSSINITIIFLFDVITAIEFPLVWHYVFHLTKFDGALFSLASPPCILFILLNLTRYGFYIYFYIKALRSDFVGSFLTRKASKILR